MKLYSIYDIVSKRYNAPFLAESDDVAIRQFKSGVSSHPFAYDFELYCVGNVDLENYKIPFVSIESVFVCSFSQFSEVNNG